MKCYKVTAKCGHVGGPGKYILINFYTVAADGKTAAADIRMAPRVKHDHKDAIREVFEISFEEYIAGQAEFNADPYNLCRNPQEQRWVWDLIKDRVLEEPVLDYRTEAGKRDGRRNAKRSLRYGYDAYGKRCDTELWDDYKCA